MPIFADLPTYIDILPADGGAVGWADATDRDDWYAAVHATVNGITVLPQTMTDTTVYWTLCSRPAHGAVATMNDGLSSPTPVLSVGVGTEEEYAAVWMPSVATGTWEMEIADGTLHYSLSNIIVTHNNELDMPNADTVPAEYAEVDKQVMNNAGITVEVMRGKKTEAELAEELIQQKLTEAIESQRRSDAALLATYLSIDEILLHRDRRIELFQAQAKVTELYLQNIKRRLDSLLVAGSAFAPYSEDPDAAMIDPELADDITDTRDTIERHEANLDRFHTDEELIASRFDGDINRFKMLKGIE